MVELIGHDGARWVGQYVTMTCWGGIDPKINLSTRETAGYCVREAYAIAQEFAEAANLAYLLTELVRTGHDVRSAIMALNE